MTDAGGAPRQAQSATAPRCRARRAAACAVRSASDHRRRRLRQDRDAGASRRASHRKRRRSAPHHALDLFAAGGGGDDAPGRSHSRRCNARPFGRPVGCDRLGRHLPFDRCPDPARICRRHRTCPRIHDSRSRGFRRPDESDPPRARLFGDQRALSGQRHLPFDLFARGQQRDRVGRSFKRELPVVRHLAGRTASFVRALRRSQAGAERPRLRRSACSIGRI